MYLQVTSKQFLIRLNAIYEEKGSCFFFNRFIIRRAYWAQISRFSNLLIWTCRTMDFRGIAQSCASVWFCLFGLYSLVTWAVLGVKQERKALPVIIGDKKKDGEEKKLLWLKSDRVICHPDLNFVVINLLTHKFCYHFTISQDIMCIFHLSFGNDCIV